MRTLTSGSVAAVLALAVVGCGGHDRPSPAVVRPARPGASEVVLKVPGMT